MKMAATWASPEQTNIILHYPHSIPAISPRKMVGLPSFLSFQITRFKTTCSLLKRRSLLHFMAQKRRIRQLSSKPALVPVPLAQPWLSALALGPGLATEYCHDGSKKKK